MTVSIYFYPMFDILTKVCEAWSVFVLQMDSRNTINHGILVVDTWADITLSHAAFYTYTSTQLN